MANLRKQHLWGVIGDAEFKAEHQALELQKRGLEPKSSMRSTPDLDRAAELMRDLPALWEHPGVTPDQRRDLTREVFDEVRLREGKLVAVKPRAEYVPLFAYSVWKGTGGGGGKRSPWVEQASPTYVLALGTVVLGVGDWLNRVSKAD